MSEAAESWLLAAAAPGRTLLTCGSASLAVSAAAHGGATGLTVFLDRIAGTPDLAGVNVVRCRLEQLPLLSHAFDAALMLAIRPLTAAQLAELRRVLAPRGRLRLAFPEQDAASAIEAALNEIGFRSVSFAALPVGVGVAAGAP